MNWMVRAYQIALCLYPKMVQAEYGEEMAGAFAETCRDACRESFWSALKVGLLELRDLPINLIKEHWANLWRNPMSNQPSPIQSFPQSALRGALSFGVSFFLISLAYCLTDVLINSGKTWDMATNIWRIIHLSPTALASGIGAVLLGTGVNRRQVLGSAVACFIGYTLIATLGSPLIAKPPSAYNSVTIWVFPLIFMALAGMIVGGGIGIFQRGWRQAGRFALAGMAGFILGWFVNRILAGAIVLTFYDNINQILIGSSGYFAYMLAPVLFYGSLVGLCLGMAAYKKAEKPLLLA